MASPIPTPDPNSPAWNLYVDSQTFNLTALDGTQFQTSLVAVNQVTYSLLSQVAFFSFTVGFNGMMIIVLLLLTNRKKALRPIFIFNFVCLVLNCARNIIYISMFCSQYGYGVGENILGAIGQYPLSLYATPNVIGNIFNMLLYASILISLILQVRVVFAAEPRTKLIVTILLTLDALLVQSCWMAFEIQLMRNLFGLAPALYNLYPTLLKLVQINFIIFVGIACLTFLVKLFVTIKRRRRMGFQSFGPLHILFIMFGQCLIIPLLFYILDFTLVQFSNIDELGQTFLIASLPLSALWASHESESHQNGRVTTTSSSVTADSSLSSRFRNKFRYFNKASKDTHSTHSDLEKASNFSENEGTKKTDSVNAFQLHPSNESSQFMQ